MCIMLLPFVHRQSSSEKKASPSFQAGPTRYLTMSVTKTRKEIEKRRRRRRRRKKKFRSKGDGVRS